MKVYALCEMQMYRTFLLLFLPLSLFSQVVEGGIKQVNIATVNTLLIFTSQKGLNSGIYYFTDTPSDLTMRIYHLPFNYTFKSNDALKYFIVGNVGYSSVRLSKNGNIFANDVSLTTVDDIQTYTVGLGGGITYELLKGLSYLIGVEGIYSRSGVSIEVNNSVDEIIHDFFNNNYSDNFTYKLFTSLEYKDKIGEYKPYARLEYNLYDTKSSFSFDSISSFRSESSVLSFALGCESPAIYTYSDTAYLTLEGYVQGHRLYGAVRDIAKVERYGSYGGVAYWYTEDEPWWASRFFLELNRVDGIGIYGYNIGAGFSVDF